MNRSILNNKKEWEELATLDPLWSILSVSERRFSKWDVEEFFATGKREVEEILVEVRSLGHSLDTSRTLDFGCGIGRVTRALSEHFTECYGVDISEKMITLAKRLNGDIKNCWFGVNVANDLGIFPDNHFDMVYSNIVLQHLPDRDQIKGYIADFVRVLKPGGLVVFQLASWMPVKNRIQLRRRLYLLLRHLGADVGFLYRRLGLHPMRMNFMREEEVVSLLKATGARVLQVRRAGSGGRSFQSCVYFVAKY